MKNEETASTFETHFIKYDCNKLLKRFFSFFSAGITFLQHRPLALRNFFARLAAFKMLQNSFQRVFKYLFCLINHVIIIKNQR